MTNYYQLPKTRWTAFFDDLTSALKDRKQVHIEVAGLKIGLQVAVEHLPLSGLTYDHKNDTFYVYTSNSHGNLNHAIASPREIWVDMASSGLSRIVVKDADGQQQFIRLRDPIALPRPIQEDLRRFPSESRK